MEEIKALNNKLVNLKTLEDVECSEYVCGFETLGSSTQYRGATWFDVTLINGDRIDLFCNI